MKKFIVVLLVGMMLLSMCACSAKEATVGGENTETKESEYAATEEASVEEPTDTTESAPVSMSFGDTIKTDYYEFTPKFEGFAEEVANWPDENFLFPNGKIAGSNPYKAADDKTFMYFSGVLNYIGDSKNTEKISLYYKVYYDDGYVFDGNHDYNSFFSDSDGNNDTRYHTAWGNTTDIKNGEWEYNNTMSFAPLSTTTTRYVRFAIEVPKVLETNSEKPLLVIFTFDGIEYSFPIR